MATPFDSFMASRQNYGPQSGGGISPIARGLGDAATGILGAIEGEVQQQREFDRKMTLEEWKFQKQKELALFERDLEMELKKTERGWNKEDAAAAAISADQADLVKRARDVEDFRSEKQIEAAIAEAKAVGDHEREMLLAEMKEAWKAQYNPTGGSKAKKEDLDGLRSARLFEYAQTLAPDFASSFEADPEKADWKSIANELRKQGKTEEAKKIAEYNSALQGATTAEEIKDVFEQFNKPAEDDPLGLLD